MGQNGQRLGPLVSLVEKGTEHTIFLSAHDRIVTDHEINNQTGLDSPISNGDTPMIYVGIVSSEYLDENVTQERNNFDITKKMWIGMQS